MGSPYAADRARGIDLDPGDLASRHDAHASGRAWVRQQHRGREHGLHLHVLRVVRAAGERVGEERLVIVQVGCVDVDDLEPGFSLPHRTSTKRLEGARGSRNDEPTLGLELASIAEQVTDLSPLRDRQQREVELRAFVLVGHEDVALARARRATADRTAVDNDDVQTLLGEEVRAARTHDARADDHGVRRTRHPVVPRHVTSPPT